MSALPKLSDGLAQLVDVFRLAEDIADDDEVRLDGQSARNILRLVATMHSLAVDQEIELQCLRDMEAGREFRSATEGLAAEQLSRLIAENDGKIIRPDFGGTKK